MSPDVDRAYEHWLDTMEACYPWPPEDEEEPEPEPTGPEEIPF